MKPVDLWRALGLTLLALLYFIGTASGLGLAIYGGRLWLLDRLDLAAAGSLGGGLALLAGSLWAWGRTRFGPEEAQPTPRWRRVAGAALYALACLVCLGALLLALLGPVPLPKACAGLLLALALAWTSGVVRVGQREILLVLEKLQDFRAMTQPPAAEPGAALRELPLVSLGGSAFLLWHRPNFLPWLAVLALWEWLSIALHELGHLAFARLAGRRVLTLQIGGGPTLLARRLLGLGLHLRLWPREGLVESTGRADRSWRWQNFLTVLGGPAVDVTILFALLTWAPRIRHEALSNAGLALWLAIGFIAFRLMSYSLIPTVVQVDGRLLPSDGWWLSSLWRIPPNEAELCRSTGVLADYWRLRKGGQPAAAEEVLAAAARAKWKVSPLPLCRATQFLEDRKFAAALPELAAVEGNQSYPDSIRRWAEYMSRFARVGTGEPELVEAEVRVTEESGNASRQQDMAMWLDQLACGPLVEDQPDLLPTALRWIRAARLLCPELVTLQATEGALLSDAGEHNAAIERLEAALARAESVSDRSLSAFFLARSRRALDPQAEVAALLAEAKRGAAEISPGLRDCMERRPLAGTASEFALATPEPRAKVAP